MRANVTTQFSANYGKVLLAVALDPKAVGQRIKHARVAKGYTQLAFALEFGVSPSMVSKWERADPLPPVRVLIRIAEFLEVDAAEFVEEAPTGTDQIASLRGEVAEVHEMVAELLRRTA